MNLNFKKSYFKKKGMSLLSVFEFLESIILTISILVSHKWKKRNKINKTHPI